jgi:hypothetical protein
MSDKRNEELSNIMSEYNKMQDVARKNEEKLTIKEQRKKALIKALRICEVILCGFLIFVFVRKVSQEIRAYSKEPLWVMGITRDSDIEIRGCIANLWQIRDGIDKYYMNTKAFPVAMQDLYAQGFSDKKLVCPITGQEYEMKNKENVVYCSNADKHGVNKLWLDVKTGPPRLERW